MISLPTKVLESILVTIILPSFLNVIILSISEQSQTNSSLFKDVPIKPSSLLTYSLEFLTTTFFASTSAKILISVFLFLFLPKTDLKFLKYLIKEGFAEAIKNRKIEKKIIRDLIFSNKLKKNKLEKYLHKEVKIERTKFIKRTS